jgi:hypothetical protein
MNDGLKPAHIVWIGIIILVVIGITVYSVKSYKAYKSQNAIADTNKELLMLKGSINSTVNKIKHISFILVNSEKSKINERMSDLNEKMSVLETDIASYSALGDTDLIRSKLEVGFDFLAKKNGYITPLERIKVCQDEVDSIVGFCENRNQIRTRAIRNEMTLKVILKKPISGIELPNDLSSVSKYCSDLLSFIPQDNDKTKAALASLNDPNLNNGMGMKYLASKPVLDEINKVAKTEEIKNIAAELYDSARKSYSAVKGVNDNIHWYVPEKDDGKYDNDAYNALLSSQAKALSRYEAGNSFLARLASYLSELKSQNLVYVSSNSYDDITFNHSEQIEEPATRHRKDGSVEHYTKYRTRYYTTNGRAFYYTITTVDHNSSSSNRIKLGEKDSDSIFNSFGGWRTWDYKPDQQQGHLIEYKPYGYDNRSKVVGGTYNPTIHTITR